MQAKTMKHNARKIAAAILSYLVENDEWDLLRGEVNNIDNLFSFWDKENISEDEQARRWDLFDNEIHRIIERIKP